MRSFLSDEYSANRPMGKTNFFQLSYLARILSRKLMYLLVLISVVLSCQFPVSQGCNKHSCAVILFLINLKNFSAKFHLLNDDYIKILIQCKITYSLLLTSNLLMKSLASCDTSRNASSSKSQSQALTFLRVSISLSPANGERPLSKTYAKTPQAHISV